MIRNFRVAPAAVTLIAAGLLFPCLAQAGVQDSLLGLKTTLISGLLPVLAVMSLGFAAFQFFTGNPNSRQTLTWAIVGSIVLFGAQSIVDLIQRLVR